MLCHCGSNETFANCCQPYLDGKQIPPTPEKLMRSRYSAHVLKLVPYIRQTMLASDENPFLDDETAEWLDKIQWEGLTVFDTRMKTPTLGYVSFDAVYSEDGKIYHICEKSEFHLEDGRWIYVRGKTMNPAGRKKLQNTE